MANEKMTHKDYYENLISIVKDSGADNSDELIGFIESRLELLERKKSSKVSEAKLAEIEANKALVLSALAETPKTVTEIQTVCEGYSNQKITSILSKLVADGLAERKSEKGKSYYTLVMGE